MKIRKESLLQNDLSVVVKLAQEEEVLIMSNQQKPVVVMSLEQYNEMKQKLYENRIKSE